MRDEEGVVRPACEHVVCAPGTPSLGTGLRQAHEFRITGWKTVGRWKEGQWGEGILGAALFVPYLVSNLGQIPAALAPLPSTCGRASQTRLFSQVMLTDSPEVDDFRAQWA